MGVKVKKQVFNMFFKNMLTQLKNWTMCYPSLSRVGNFTLDFQVSELLVVFWQQFKDALLCIMAKYDVFDSCQSISVGKINNQTVEQVIGYHPAKYGHFIVRLLSYNLLKWV